MKAEKYSIKIHVINPLFFAYNIVTVEVHSGFNGLCYGRNRTDRFTGAEERVMGFVWCL